MAVKGFTRDSVGELREIERALAAVLNRVNQEGHTEGAIAIFALVRLAREILNRYPADARRMLVDQLLVPFLQHEPIEDQQAGRSLLIN
jgi:hypothetical protein